jgi:hypothetical protein
MGGWGKGGHSIRQWKVCSAERGTFLGRPMLATFRVGGWMESRAAHYRRLAEECLALSRLDGFSMQGRLNLLEMARIWNRLAQQQQQVQPECKLTG